MADTSTPQAPQPSPPSADRRREDALDAEASHAGEEDGEEIAADDVGATALAEKLGQG